MKKQLKTELTEQNRVYTVIRSSDLGCPTNITINDKISNRELVRKNFIYFGGGIAKASSP